MWPTFRTAAAILALTVGGGMSARADIIDRVLAVVNGAVILQTDARGAVRLGLVTLPAGPEGNRAVLDRLIERRLVLIEVNRSATPDPPEDAIDARFKEVRSRFASEQDFTRALAEVGLSVDQVRGFIRDDLRIAAYVQQRFGTMLQPSETEILDYYRDHPEKFTRNGVLRPFDEVHDEARALLIEERRARAISEWIAGLRRRADITIPAVVRR